MKKIAIPIPDEEEVVVLEALINGKNELLVALDTAATHTTIDSNALHLFGFSLGKSSIKILPIERHDSGQYNSLCKQSSKCNYAQQ